MTRAARSAVRPVSAPAVMMQSVCVRPRLAGLFDLDQNSSVARRNSDILLSTSSPSFEMCAHRRGRLDGAQIRTAQPRRASPDSQDTASLCVLAPVDNHCSLSARVRKVRSRSWNCRFSSGAVALSARSLYSVAVAPYCSAVHIDESLARADLGRRVRRPAAPSPLNADCSE
jgi:hypothetical protein